MDTEFYLQKKYKFISASTLKVIAVVSMFIDHVGAGLLLMMIRAEILPFGMGIDETIKLYEWIRHFGRMAFPIYCYLLVEGLLHTHNVKKYMENMGFFGVLSELFFDLTLRPRQDVASLDVINVLRQNEERVLGATNVYFTLLIGLIVIYLMKCVEEKFFEENSYSVLGYTARNPMYVLLYFAPAAAGAGLAYLIKSDYNAWGIILIVIFFVFRKTPLIACIFGYLFFMNMFSETWSLPAFILLLCYNGKRGYLSGKFKYAFYAFYPVHLLLIYLIRCAVMR